MPSIKLSVKSNLLLTSNLTLLDSLLAEFKGEIDIICKDGKYLVFVEVKYRSNSRFGSPEAAVTPVKQRQISRVALYYMKRYGYDPYNTPVRFDVIAVAENEIHHMKDAFPYQGYY